MLNIKNQLGNYLVGFFVEQLYLPSNLHIIQAFIKFEGFFDLRINYLSPTNIAGHLVFIVNIFNTKCIF